MNRKLSVCSFHYLQAEVFCCTTGINMTSCWSIMSTLVQTGDFGTKMPPFFLFKWSAYCFVTRYCDNFGIATLRTLMVAYIQWLDWTRCLLISWKTIEKSISLSQNQNRIKHEISLAHKDRENHWLNRMESYTNVDISLNGQHTLVYICTWLSDNFPFSFISTHYFLIHFFHQHDSLIYWSIYYIIVNFFNSVHCLM